MTARDDLKDGSAMAQTRVREAPALPPERTPAVEEPSPTLLGLLKGAAADPRQRTTLVGGLTCLTLCAILFRDSLWHFVYAWTTDDNYSHGFLVPPLSLYFASQVARRGPVPVRSGVLLGSILVCGSLAVRLLTVFLPIPFLGDLALLIGLCGVFALLLGTEALRRYWFAFFFLIFMVPLPIALYSRIASPLQLLASQAASAVMNASGVPVLCEGNRMTLPGGVQMFVAEACSGMRQLTGFLALTTAVAYLAQRPWWYRMIVVCSALPIALFANVTRVVVTGYIMHFLNPQFASGAYHTAEGILLMGFGLLLLNALCSLLNQLAADSPATSGPEASCSGIDPGVLARRGMAGRAVLTGPGGWTPGSFPDHLAPTRRSEESS
jgi:exosortase